jgi:hypothetical protein
MEYITQADDDEPSSIAVTKRTKRKWGLIFNKTQSFDKSLEELADKLLAEKK